MPLGPQAVGTLLRQPGVENWEEERGAFGELLTTFGRPGFAIRDFLSGDFQGAAEQAAMFGGQILAAIPTGGLSMIDPRFTPQGAIDLFGDVTGLYEYDAIPARETEREFSDMLQEWGVADFEDYSPWQRFAVDLIGGMLTDPFSFLGAAPANLVKGGLTGMGKGLARNTVAKALEATDEGAKALRRASVMEAEQILTKLRGRATSGGKRGAEGSAFRNLQPDRVRQAAEALVDGEDLARFGIALRRDTDLGMLREMVKRRGAGRVFNEAVPRGRMGPPAGDVLKSTARNRAAIEQARAALSAEGKIMDRAWRFGVPFTKFSTDFQVPKFLQAGAEAATPFRRSMIPTLAGGQLGGFAGEAGGLAGAALGRMSAKIPIVDRKLEDLTTWVKRNLYDKFHTKYPGLSRQIGNEFRRSQSQIAKAATEGQRILADVDYADTELLSDVLDDVVDARAQRWADEGLPLQEALAAHEADVDELTGLLEKWAPDPKATTLGQTTFFTNKTYDPNKRVKFMRRAERKVKGAKPVTYGHRGISNLLQYVKREAEQTRGQLRGLMDELDDFEAAKGEVIQLANQRLQGRVNPETINQAYDWWFGYRRRELQDLIYRAERQLFDVAGQEVALPRDKRFRQVPRPLQKGDVIEHNQMFGRVEKFDERTQLPIVQPLESDPAQSWKQWRNKREWRVDANGKRKRVELGPQLWSEWDPLNPDKGDRILEAAATKRDPYRMRDLLYVPRRAHPEVAAAIAKIKARTKDKDLTDVLDDRKWAGLSRQDWLKNRKLRPTEDYQTVLYQILEQHPEGQELLRDPAFKMRREFRQKLDARRQPMFDKDDNPIMELFVRPEEGSAGLQIRGLGDLGVHRHREHQLYMLRERLLTIPQQFFQGHMADIGLARELGLEEARRFAFKDAEEIQTAVSRLVLQDRANIPYSIRRLGSVFKGGVAYLWPAYYVRNYMGMLTQGHLEAASNPVQAFGRWLGIGLDTIPAVGNMLMSRGKRSTAGWLNKANKLAAASAGNPQALEQIADLRIGRWTGPQVLSMAEGNLLKQNVLYREELQQMFSNEAVELARRGGRNRFTQFLSDADKWLTERFAEVSTFFEDRARLGLFSELLEDGVEPGDAIRRVQEAMVDYDLQSTYDEWLRQILPFIRFELATVPKVATQLHRPLIRQPVVASRRESQRQDEGAGPMGSRRGMTLPLAPGLNLAGFGQVQEAADMAMRQAMPTPKQPWQPELRRALSRLSPVGLRPVAEFGFGVEAYSDRPTGHPRVVPEGQLRDAMDAMGLLKEGNRGQMVTKPAFERAMAWGPLSRFYGMARKASRDGVAEMALQAGIGLRFERAAPSQEQQRLMEAYMDQRAREGDFGVIERLYRLGRGDPELRQAQRALKRLEKRNRRKRRRR